MDSRNYIIGKSFRSFFLAAVLSSLISQIQSLVDGVIVSNLVNPNALGAVQLAIPIYAFIFVVPSLIAVGSSLICSVSIGAQDYEKVNRIFSICIILVPAVAVLFSVLFFCFSGRLASLLSADDAIKGLLMDYMPILFLSAPVQLTAIFMGLFAEIAGRPKLTTFSMFVQFITNVFLDLLFVVVFDAGIRGAAWATMISSFAGLLCFSSFLFGKNRFYSFVKPEICHSAGLIRDIFKKGSPSAIESLSTAILMVCMNVVILNALGADGLFVLTVSMQILLVFNLVLSGVGASINSIGSAMIGERDMDGYRSFIKNLLKFVCILAALLSLADAIFPHFIAGLFGADERLTGYAVSPLRIISIMYFPFCICSVLLYNYAVLGRSAFASAISFGFFLFMFPPVLLASIIDPQSVWFILGAAMWLMFIAVMVVSYIISARNPLIAPVTLIPNYPDDISADFFVAYDDESLFKALHDINSFISISELPPDVELAVLHSVEEVANNIIDINRHLKKTGYFNIRVIYDSRCVSIFVKDDSKPYNPIRKYDVSRGNVVDEDELSECILNYYCKDLHYNYRNGINCLSMFFNY